MVKLLTKVFAFVVLVSFASAFPTNEIDDDKKIIIKENTPENIERLKNLGKDDLAEELSGQYQGDIIMSAEQMREYETESKRKTGLIASRYKWAGGVVPYKINEKDFTKEQVDYIRLGTKKLEEATCLRFVAYDEKIHNDYVSVIGSQGGCFSSVGRRGIGEQILNLAPNNLEVGCFRLYTIVHEFIHAVGFYHMQSATERDEYVRIEFDKIQPGTENNFFTYGFDVITNYEVEYDYGSVMHYGKTAFSRDGSDTIIPLKELRGETMGQRLRLSSKDTARLNSAYCGGPLLTTTQAPKTTTPNPILQSVNDWINNLLRNIFGGIRT